MAPKLTPALANEISTRASGARFSRDRAYRYLLWRTWDDQCRRRAVFVGLNPSKADEAENDPTVRRCVGLTRGFDENWRCGGLLLINLYSWCTPYPRELKQIQNPCGRAGNTWLASICQLFPDSIIIAMWGNHGEAMGQAAKFEYQCNKRDLKLCCLRKNKGGQPAHPLYLPSGVQPCHYRRTSVD